MIDDSLRRGVESYVARFLRKHVAEALLSRDGIRRSMKPEDLERLREEVLDRLDSIEREGEGDRAAVGSLVDDLIGKAAGSGTSALAVLVSLLDRTRSHKDEP